MTEALSKTDVPVPRPVLFCADRDVVGTPFHLMGHLRGRIFWSPALPELPREDRAAVIDGMNEALARLHRIDPAAIDLSDFGRPGNYFARQIGRWSGHWEASRTRENPSIEALAAWLPAHIPEGEETAICHGNFRLDNMIFPPPTSRS